jgi:hypothetical protein
MFRAVTRRPLELALAFLLVAVAAGCAGQAPAGASNARALSAWLEGQQLSVWRTFRRVGARPAHPPNHDGFTLGSPNVFAGIGAKPNDLTSLDVFWGDRRTARPLARPLTISVLLRGRGITRQEAREPVALARFPEQTLARIRHTTICVSESRRDDLKITIVDFAPVSAESNYLCRWFLVENTGRRARSVELLLKAMAPGEQGRFDDRALKLGDKLAIVSEARLSLREEQAQVSVGRVDPGERASAAVLLVATREPRALKEEAEQARGALPDLLALLNETKLDWERWCASAPGGLHTGDERTDDLLDSLLCLIRAHVGPEAVHTGSLQYSHGRAWVRDGYWVERALLELGYRREATLNLDFFHRAWRTSGIGSSYEILTGKSNSYGYQAVELPHYLVLMVRDAERLGGANGAAYWDMVSGCLDQAAVPTSGLQPMNGDETWLLASPVRELDALLDNSWLLIASAEYAAELAAQVGDAKRAARYRAIAWRARAAVERFLPQGQEWFAIGYGGDGSRDLSLCPEVLARAAILGVLPASDPRIASGLTAGWNRLNYERGIRTHARSATICGGTPGYLLWAAADSPGCAFASELARRALKFASATGCVWEFHDLYDPAWGGEKQRLWDSAVVLIGLARALFTIQTVDGRLQFVPRARAQTPPLSPPRARGGGNEEGLAPFNAERLLTDRGPALILHQSSPQHAARIARELARQRNTLFAIAPYPGQPAAGNSAIIISRSRPPSGWRQVADYWVRGWAGPPQLWVQNKGHVFLDTDRVIGDLTSCLAPVRGQPLPFPPASLDLAARLGEAPSGEADVRIVSLFRRAGGRLGLAGGQLRLTAGTTELAAKAWRDQQQSLLRLTVAMAPHLTQAEVSVTLPAGWWLVRARDMSGEWDRVRDPVGEIRLPDGRIRLDCSFRPSDRPLSLTFTLARLRTS